MYEYKLFRPSICSLKGMNDLLSELSRSGWEPVQVDSDKNEIFAKRTTTLNESCQPTQGLTFKDNE